MQSKLIVALDGMDFEESKVFVSQLVKECNDTMERIVFKVHTLVGYKGLSGVKDLFEESGASVFWDGKFHDIPNTLKGYFGVIQDLNMGELVEYVTIHGSNGYDGVQDLVNYKKQNDINTKILAVSILTSLDNKQVRNIYGTTIENAVLRFAYTSLEAGVDGIVCSPWESEILREKLGKEKNDFEIITPGIRPLGSDQGDQLRFATPKEAIAMGANHIVVGRPITQSLDPGEMVQKIFQDLDL